MIHYTENEVFNLLGSVSCKEDLIQINDYIQTYADAYAWYDIDIFNMIINDLSKALKI